LKEDKAACDVTNNAVIDAYKIYIGRVQLITLNTKASLETTKKRVGVKIQPKNHFDQPREETWYRYHLCKPCHQVQHALHFSLLNYQATY